ncbi:MAG TPA: cold shock domain-containing protein, partial [Bacteroidales bacterium]|nr:cold shock domain-containing protein [Bacteroidales bacterium]
EKTRDKKRKEKEQRKEDRKAGGKSSLDDMIAYVDAYGNITNTPPDPSTAEKVKAEDIELGVPKREALDPRDLVRTGIVSFMNESKGFGFIRDLESGQSVFVHVNGTLEEIRENNRVTFTLENGPKGPMAVNVKVVR